MPVYLVDDKVLLDGNKVAVDEACCCSSLCDCSPGVSVSIDVHATGNGTDCATLNVTDSLSFSLGAGFTFYDFSTVNECMSGCTYASTIAARVVYNGSVSCSGGVLQLFLGSISACCYQPIHDPCDSSSFGGCNCGSASGGPEIITCSGVYIYNFSGSSDLFTWSLDVTVTVTIP